MKRAFAGATYYGVPLSGKLVPGFKKVIVFESTNIGTTRLCAFLPQTGPCASLKRSYLNPWMPTESGALGGEVAALLMNIAYNDQRLMPKNRGYDLENFLVAQGFFKLRPVRQVLDAASRVLGGAPPCIVGLPGCAPLTQIVRDINANYELLPSGTTMDRGYLIPNRGFGPPNPPHPLVVP
jgi:hypothetical protein